MLFTQSASISKFKGQNALAIILDRAVTTGVVNGDVDPCGACIQGVLDEAAYDGIEGCNGGGGPEAADDVLWQGLNLSGHDGS